MLTSGIAYLLLVLSTAVNIYLFVLFVRVLLTWFPNIDFSNPCPGWRRLDHRPVSEHVSWGDPADRWD
jgi:hypothetical protein